MPLRFHPCQRRGNILIGCLVALGVIVILVIIGVVVVALNWRSWTASAMRGGTVAAVRAADIPESEKPEIIAQLDRVTDGFRDASITFEQFGTIMESIFDDVGILEIGTIEVIAGSYLDASGLDDATKQAGRTALYRYQRGLYEGDISRSTFQAVIAPVNATAQGGRGGSVQFSSGSAEISLQPKAGTTDDELKQVIENAKKEADHAEIPADAEPVDLSDAIKREIDDVLGPAAEQLPPPKEAAKEAPDQVSDEQVEDPATGESPQDAPAHDAVEGDDEPVP